MASNRCVPAASGSFIFWFAVLSFFLLFYCLLPLRNTHTHISVLRFTFILFIPFIYLILIWSQLLLSHMWTTLKSNTACVQHSRKQISVIFNIEKVVVWSIHKNPSQKQMYDCLQVFQVSNLQLSEQWTDSCFTVSSYCNFCYLPFLSFAFKFGQRRGEYTNLILQVLA